jgi:hypothetical protein
MKCVFAKGGGMPKLTLRRQVNGGVSSKVQQVRYTCYDGSMASSTEDAHPSRSR